MPATRTKLDPNGTRQRIEAVASILEGYAQRGVFRGFSPAEKAGQGKAVFRLLWHRDRIFEFVFDPSRNSMSFPSVLPNVSTEMHRDLKRFIESRSSADLPEHRRIDPSKVQINTSNRKGAVAINLLVLDVDDEYGVRKLIHLVHEIFLTFLLDGLYYEYMVENFDLDPDRL